MPAELPHLPPYTAKAGDTLETRRRSAGVANPTIVGALSDLKVRSVRLLLIVLLMFLSGHWAFAMAVRVDPDPPSSASAVEQDTLTPPPEQDEHGLSQKAIEIARLFGFPITNSMVVTWLVSLGLIAFAQAATRRMKSVPDGAQNLFEWLVESLYNFLKGLLGQRLTHRTL